MEAPTLMDGICTKLGQECGGKYTARGLCYRHYRQALKSGEIQSQRGTPAERFWRKVDKNGPVPIYRPDLGCCWLWTGALDSAGYGSFSDTGSAHRFAYHLLIGPIASGLELDHLCRVPACVRPTHMEPVSHAENIRRGAMGHLGELRPPKPWPTHCPKGHAYDEKNTAVNDRNRPVCRRCSSDKTIRWQRRTAGIDVPKIPVAKLTEADVRYIRASNLSGYQLAHRFGVAPLTVSKARRGITWKQVA